MNSGKGFSPRVKDFFQRTKKSLSLQTVTKGIGLLRIISSPPFQRSSSSIQVWGKKEFQYYQNLPQRKKKVLLQKKLAGDVACILFADGISVFTEIREEAKRRRISLFCTEASQKKCREEVNEFFSAYCADKKIISGGLLQIFGLGVLIKGESGIGKSESALELIFRGSRFVSDDVTHIEKTANGKLIGTSPSLSRYFMEIRGLGIINIKEIFGPKAVRQKAEVNLVINLEKWKERKSYDRLELKFSEACEILGVKIPQVSIPIAPGRNIATLIEVASRVHMHREKGYNASREIIKKLDRALSVR